MFYGGLLLAMAGFLSFASGGKITTGTTLSIQWFPSDYDPLAVCNDGTRGAYYFSESISPEMKDTYLIFLPGGGQCFDEASCQDRWASIGSTYMSSSGFTNTVDKSGLLDSNPNRSPLWGANKASLGYCSSDGYMGDAGASVDTWEWHFRGQRLVQSMIRHLIEFKGLSGNSTVLLAGSSAGARGIMTLAASLFADHLPKGSRVALFLDSPYYIDIPPYSPNFQGFPYQEQQKSQHINTAAIIPSECSEFYRAASSDAHASDWKCQFGQYRMPFDSPIPYLLIASQYDAYQLSGNTQQNPPYLGPDHDQVTNYGVSFANQTRALLTTLVETAQNPQGKTLAVFSWACYNHAVAETISFSTLTTETGVTQQDALKAFLATDPFVVVGAETSKVAQGASNLQWIDQCNGFACGSGCAARR